MAEIPLVPTVSVIIPAYNQDQFVAEALESVLSQTTSPYELIVVNDGSTDDTAQILMTYQTKHPNLIHILHQPNQGAAAARNAGCAVASGNVLAFLDADDVWMPTKLERQVQFLTDNPEVGLVHCGLNEVSDTGVLLGQRLDGLEGWVALDMLLWRHQTILGAGSSALLPRQIFDEVGGFDVTLPPSEDWDFCYRVACRYPIGFVPEALVHYRLHSGNSHHNVSQMEVAMLRAYEKAFDNASPALLRKKRRCYANLHAVLSGCYLSQQLYLACLRHMTYSLWLGPTNITRLGGYLIRCWRRRIAKYKTKTNCTS